MTHSSLFSVFVDYQASPHFPVGAVLASVFGAGLLFLIIVALCFCCRRRRDRQGLPSLPTSTSSASLFSSCAISISATGLVHDCDRLPPPDTSQIFISSKPASGECAQLGARLNRAVTQSVVFVFEHYWDLMAPRPFLQRHFCKCCGSLLCKILKAELPFHRAIVQHENFDKIFLGCIHVLIEIPLVQPKTSQSWISWTMLLRIRPQPLLWLVTSWVTSTSQLATKCFSKMAIAVQ